ncbi:YMGG-like glycine zipper-containing protein [Arcticibacter eurypsychrophilus]|uniref:YMGG-like glycine zipper-containing protein n=1 Tax=Arcticibacter eurypsychrophilus TaxID=1434752 RepID=UPI00084DE8E8|nr:YMGG-like glycine zipper-containing protein [Arcticibacter eurypsychrophilus]
MKKLLTILAFASIVVACSSNDKIKADLKAKNDSMKMMKDSLKLDSFQRASAAIEEQKRIEAKEAEQAAVLAAAARRSTRSTNTVRYVNYPSRSTSTSSATTQSQKKGMSSAAKGALIGGGAGAVTGILVDKKNARGAIIGGVLGAGTGYVIGRDKDVKSGRVQK